LCLLCLFCVCHLFVFVPGHRCDCPTHGVALTRTHDFSMTIVYALPDRFA